MSSSSSSSRKASVDEQIVKQLDVKTLLSNVTVGIDGLHLGVKLNIKVDQSVQVKIPLKALVSYEEAEIVPSKDENGKVKGGNSSSSSDSDVDDKQDNKPSPAPKPIAGSRMCKIEVNNLPKESLVSKVDPYFKLFVDGFHVYGGPDLAQSGKKEAAWSFQLPQIRLLNAKIVRVEFYDKDKMSKDDLLGITEIPAEQLRSKKAVLQAPVLGSKTTKAGTKMNMVLLN